MKGIEKAILFVLISICFATYSKANQVANSEMAVAEFEFEQEKALSKANELLGGYFTSDYYRKKNYDRQHPVLGSFIGTDCNRKTIKLVFVTYKSLTSDGMLWVVFRFSETGKLTLEGEGVGLA